MALLMGRLFLVTTGFLVASAVALTSLFVLGSLWLGEAFVGESDPELWPIAPIIGGMFFAGAVGPALTAVPGLVAIVLGEGLNLRSIVYYLLAGAASLAAIPLLAARNNPQAETIPAFDYFILFIAAGLLAGFVYWAIAGRSA